MKQIDILYQNLLNINIILLLVSGGIFLGGITDRIFELIIRLTFVKTMLPNRNKEAGETTTLPELSDILHNFRIFETCFRKNSDNFRLKRIAQT
jgi:hypothetical protein